MAIWESIREAMDAAHARGKDWLTVNDITREVLATDSTINKGTINALVRYHCINDPSKKHSPSLQYRSNPLFVTDEPRTRGKRYRLLTDSERAAFIAQPRDDLDLVSYAQTVEWLDQPSTELTPTLAEESVEEPADGDIPGLALLELHLQDYIHRNWQQVFPELTLYQGEEGREFRTSDPSVGILDFLCTAENGDFVVIETKRDVAARKAVGQILSYMGWVQEKLCSEGQQVRGILVCGGEDDDVRLAIKAVPTLSLYTYEISFALTPSTNA